MDIDASDPRSLDVSHTVSNLSFRFYSDKEARRLSVRRLTSPHAFDELGRPISRGLYDPALGPVSFEDGLCVTCGLSYSSCPGHFGHIELPVPIVNPLLSKLVLKILRSSCWRCPLLLVFPSDLDLLLARLYFEDACMPKCALAVDSFRGLRHRHVPQSLSDAAENTRREAVTGNLVFNWRAYFRAMPDPLARYLQDCGSNDVALVESRILEAARVAWRKARREGRLAARRSQGWKSVVDTILHSNFRAKCPVCFYRGHPVRIGMRGRMFRTDSHGDVVLSPTQIEAHMAALWNTHRELFDMLFGLRGRELTHGDPDPAHMRLFVGVVLVPPSRFRPAAKTERMAYAAEHPQNVFYQRLLTEIEIILTANEYGLRTAADGDASPDEEEEGPTIEKPTKARFALAMSSMQEALRDLYDSSGKMGGTKIQMTGIRQQLESKEGLLRQHMMGKRVNFSCRSVIGPDVFLDTNEVGIPESFAKLLTIPEPVTARNLKQMQRAVLNGPNVHPGSMAVEDWAGIGSHRVVRFPPSITPKRLEIQASLLLQSKFRKGKHHANGHAQSMHGRGPVVEDFMTNRACTVPKRVHRHLKTGDIVLFNRQPTLHRNSIMAHKVRVLPGDRTIRFHYANCGSYNADFDGDEMNVHVPQDYLARAEAEELLLSSKHYIVPTSGAPVRGLIQDSIAAATLISHRDTFFDRGEFMQLLYSATERIMGRPSRSSERYILPNPAVLKPRPLWTGKQLITSILFVVRNGKPGLFLTSKSKVKTNIVGEDDAEVVFRDGQFLKGILDKSSIGSSMYGIVHAIQEAYGCDTADDFLNAMSRVCVFFLRSHGHTTGIEDLLLQEEGEAKRMEIIAQSIEQVGIDAANKVYSEMSKGAKRTYSRAKSLSEARNLVEEMIRRDGNEAEDRLDSAMKSALNLAASEVMKECVPATLKKRFPSNGFALMTNTGAKGSAVNAAQISCLLGSTVLEGKRVPRMGGSGATLPCFAPFDAAPNAGGFISGRFLTGISPQEFFFHALSGREGLLDTSLKTANSGYLQRCLIKHMEGILLHYDHTVRDSDDSVVQFIYGDDGIDPSKSRWLTDQVDWQVENASCFGNGEDAERGEVSINTKWRSRGTGGDTILELASPGALSKLGAISEKFNEAVVEAEKLAGSRKGPRVRHLLEQRYRSCALDPGECVGVVAAQGVGEPSTQMTLNTFHHAGSSSAHVTLGIPRLRELLMTASKYPKTPSMTLPISASDQERGAKELMRRLEKIALVDLLVKVSVREMGIDILLAKKMIVRKTEVKLFMADEAVYESQLGFGFDSIRSFVAEYFLPMFDVRLRSEMKRISVDVKEGKIPDVDTYIRHAMRPRGPEDSLVRGQPHVAGKEVDDPAQEAEQVPGDSTDGHDGDPENDYQSSSDESMGDEDPEDERKDSRKRIQARIAAQQKESQGEANALGPETAENKEKSVKSNHDPEVIDGKGANEADDKEEHIMGQVGYIYGSFHGQNKNTLVFNWNVPAALYGKIDIAGLAQETAANLMLKEVKLISRCFIDSSSKGCLVVTEGSNIPEIIEQGQDLVDFNRLETNDMYGILQRYGVEAMRTALIKEFVKIFDAYGIPVNIRHLRLIADYMTAAGGYRAFSRLTIEDAPSPVQQITFETSVKFLTDCALDATEDAMRNPSAAIATGQVYGGGTGGFQLLQGIN
eukprot:GFKZ01002840.1.p1 GENE.GFKZ01002840.1~~GFKZ01002840.1.p1  ORF type:complete len:1684 (-),score=219.39 GFKZ01002840.1:1449-6500(-)